MERLKPPTIGENGKRIWIYPAEVTGRFMRIRTALAVVLSVFFFSLPWLKINGLPFVRLSFLNSHFYLLGKQIFMYEFYHFVLLLLILVLTLFIASALYGRIWCGYACPQTIFIEHVFRRIETLIEGSGAHRKNQDAHKKTPAWLFKKVIKHFLFVFCAFAFAANLVAIFCGTEPLTKGTSSTALTMVSIIGFLAYFDGAYLREQFCTMLCPYARFQAVLQDNASKNIAYDFNRGEPRGKRRAISSTEGEKVRL